MAIKVTRRDVLKGVALSAAPLVMLPRNAISITPKIHDVFIDSFLFAPQKIFVSVGDTIRWVNKDLAPHTATALDESWDTGEIVKGDSRSIVVTKDMETDYFCLYHPHMRGKLVIG